MNYELLKKNIYEKGLSLSKLAEKIGVDKTNIYRTFNYKTLTVKKLEDICNLLEIPISTLFEEPKKEAGINERITELENRINKLERNTIFAI